MSSRRINAYFICGGRYHDMDFARHQILQALYKNDRIYTQVAADYRDTDAIEAADILVTYTCDVVPSAAEQQALKRFLHSGKRWFALHGTNSIIEFLSNGQVGAPRTAPLFMEMLGSQFLAHPPLQEFLVTVSDAAHPLVADIKPFTVYDELYLCEFHGDIHPLLETQWRGTVNEFADSDWQNSDAHPVLYLHRYGAGEVLYLMLGHCRRRLDMQPYIEEYPTLDRCSWENPMMYTLLERGIDWATGAL